MKENSGDNSVLAAIFGAAGYSDALKIDPTELQFLRKAISQQWIDRIAERCPAVVDAFRASGIEHYHRFSHLVPHDELWPKENRVLPLVSVSALEHLGFVRRLLSVFGVGCRIANVVLMSGSAPDYPEVYWRLVRPQVATDVGPLHTDKWFHNILADDGSLYGEDETTVKMWLAIYSEPGLNGLYMVPGSHRRRWRVRHVAGVDGYRRPALDESLGDFQCNMVPTAPGQALLFNEDVLHGGAINLGTTCRVSVEMTFVLRRSAIAQ